MNKYLFAESTQEYWPTIENISAKSYNDAVEKVIERYTNKLDDDALLEYSDWDKFREYLNDKYSIALSDLEIYEEL